MGRAVKAVLPFAELVLNEVQPINLPCGPMQFNPFGGEIPLSSCPVDATGEPAPWIEIHNPTDVPLSLDEYYLSPNFRRLARWRFPTGTQIGPGEYLVVWADGEPWQTRPGELHANFRLPPDRGVIALSRRAGNLLQVVDHVAYEDIGPDLSWGRVEPFAAGNQNGTSSAWRLLLHPTPGGPNRPSPLPVRINEWAVATADGDQPGWFELYNPSSKPIPLDGAILLDNLEGANPFVIPPDRMIEPKGFLRVWADGQPELNDTDREDLHVPFLMPAKLPDPQNDPFAYLALVSPEGMPVDEIFYFAWPPAMAQGRYPDGAELIYPAAPPATPGAPNQTAPVILEPPASQTVVAGQEAVFRVEATGTPPMRFDWYFNQKPLARNVGPELRLPAVNPQDEGEYVVQIVNPLGTTVSDPARLNVLTPPVFERLPGDTTTGIGAPLELATALTGPGTLRFQWRLNGQDIPGATSPELLVQAVDFANVGTYELIAYNEAGIVFSGPVRVGLDLPSPPAADFFDQRLPLTEPSGAIKGTNQKATLEPGEPLHAGQPGGRSVWYAWRPRKPGVATFETRGSGFDTLLAVYEGEDLRQLVEVASDDETGGFHTSRVQFNALPDKVYAIAVDGFNGDSGTFVLHWEFDPTAPPLPELVRQPRSQTVPEGAPARFAVTAFPPQVQFNYQWYFNGQPIPKATEPELIIPKVQPHHVGYYAVRVWLEPPGLLSHPASLEIGPVPDVHSEDRVASLFLNDLRPPNGGGNQSKGAGLDSVGAGFISVSAGTIVSHTFNNSTSSTPESITICGVLTHATRWLDFETETNGTCLVTATGEDKDGKPFDTVVAVYAITNVDELLLLACSTNEAPGQASAVRFGAVTNQRYLAVADGIDGATGNITIEWLLGQAPGIEQPTTNYTVTAGDPLELSVTASGWIPDPAYQWQHDETEVPGANAAALSFTEVLPADDGMYSVIVSNAIGQATSVVAEVTVEVPLHLELDTSSSPPGQAVLRGNALQGFMVLGSTNFQCWTLITTVSNAPFTFSQPVSLGPEPPWRFYRAAPWPLAPWEEPVWCGEGSP